MYPIFALWVRSHSDLPLKTYQIVNTFRYETKQTRAFIRVREIHFFESHTCHIDEDDAQKQVEEDFVILERLNKHLRLPYFLLKRTDWDKFPGAFYTVGVDCPLLEGRSLQLGSIHHYRENFSRPFDIKYEDVERRTASIVHQTTYGMSERLVGSVVGVPRRRQGTGAASGRRAVPDRDRPDPRQRARWKRSLAEARTLRDELLAAGIRVDAGREGRAPGSKFYHWEIKGVPLRLELGGRDIAEGKVSYAVRHDGSKGTFLRGNAVKDSQAMLDKISDGHDEQRERSASRPRSRP